MNFFLTDQLPISPVDDEKQYPQLTPCLSPQLYHQPKSIQPRRPAPLCTNHKIKAKRLEHQPLNTEHPLPFTLELFRIKRCRINGEHETALEHLGLADGIACEDEVAWFFEAVVEFSGDIEGGEGYFLRKIRRFVEDVGVCADHAFGRYVQCS